MPINNDTTIKSTTFNTDISGTIAGKTAVTGDLFKVSEELSDELELTLLSKTKEQKALEDENFDNLTFDEIVNKIYELNDKIDALYEEMNKTNALLEKTQTELQAKNDELKRQQEEYQTTQETLNTNNKKFEAITSKIEYATQDLEDDTKKRQQNAIYDAMASYNEEEDGSWEDFLAQSLKGVCADDVIAGTINSLTGQSSNVMRELGNLQTKLNLQSKEISATQTKITELKNNATYYQSVIKTDQSTADIMQEKINCLIPKMVSEEEYAFVTQNNIDLSETLSDGSPRYIFAQGKSDKKYHIYDMSDEGWSLPRKYKKDKGYDIISSGNGRLTNLKTGDEAGSDRKPVYYIGKCGSLAQMCATYCTYSPLSLDINGNGVKTSSDIVNFDIDGDGIADKINDSADAVLVFDKDGDGISGKDGSECFGDNSDLDGDGKKDGYKNGFEALLQMAKNEGLADGKKDMKLDEDDLNILEDKYGLKIKAGGYKSASQSLRDFGITEINLSNAKTNTQKNFDNQGNDLMRQAGATFKINGETREYADIWHKKQNESQGELQNSRLEFDEQNSALSFKLKNETQFIDTDSEEVSRNIFANKRDNEKAILDAKKAIKKFLK